MSCAALPDMATAYAILCPGQGGQHAAMFDVLQQDAHSAALLQQLGLSQSLHNANGVALAEVLADPALLFANRNAQALIVAAGLAAWHGLRAGLPPPSLVAGYSVGELTAYSVAGLWSPATAVALALARARCMDQCLAQVPQQGLLAVSGLLSASVRSILLQWGLFIAIETGTDAVIAGGRSENLMQAQQQLMAAGAHCTMLPVGIASHTPLMAAAQAPFAALLQEVDWQPALAPLIAGVSGQCLPNRQAAQTAILQQLTDTIDWSACLDACAERGISVALELGPGAALSRMLRERHPQIECRSLADFRSISGALRWLQGRLD